MRRSLLSLMLMATLAPAVCAQQLFQLQDEAFRDSSKIVESLGQKCLLYRSSDAKAGKQVFFTPFFAFKTDKAGKLIVDVEEPLDNSKPAKVSIYLLNSPRKLVEAISADLNAQPGQEATPAELFIGIPLANFSVEDTGNKDQEPIFDTFAAHFTTASEYPLTTFLPVDKAHEFKKRLQEGKASSAFRVSYTLNAQFIRSESSLSANLVS